MDATRVEQIMSRSVLSVDEDATVTLGKLSMDVAMVRHLPVTDARGRLVGIVALSDLLHALARAGEGPVSVRSVMTKDVVTIGRKAFAYDAARAMLEHKVGCLPVLGEGRRVEGIVTEADFVRIAESALRKAAAEGHGTHS